MGEKKDPDVLGAALAFAEDRSPTPEEARKELEAQGVDVDAFHTKVFARVRAAQKAQRLAWQDAARAKVDKFNEVDWPESDFKPLAREQLVLKLREVPEARAHMKNLDELTDDDLRTILADIQRRKRMKE
ncbi:MAG: hypothetical protein HYS27_04895 [Deltaproteobacteria bacterium]|nr:hypothetical protein [Deltaproteobacteria bacterium]